MAQSMMAENEQYTMTKEVVSSILDDRILPVNWNALIPNLPMGF